MLNKLTNKQGERMNKKEKEILKNLEETNSPMEFKLFMEEIILKILVGLFLKNLRN